MEKEPITIETLDKLAEKIAEARSQRVLIEEKIDRAREAFNAKVAPFQADVDLLTETESQARMQITEVLRELKKDKWSTERVNVALRSSTTFNIVDQGATIKFLEEQGLDHEYVERKVKTIAKGVFENRFKEGEETPGVQSVTKEFVTVTDRKPKEA